LAEPIVSSKMTDFKASVVAFEVQKNFATKFFSNKVVVKGLIDDTSAKLLDNLYNLLFVFVSIDSVLNISHHISFCRQRVRKTLRKPLEI
jgi:hypothetical protein